MINREVFFNSIRASLFAGHLDAEQVTGIGKILNEWENRKLTDFRWLANMLAQTYWETGKRMVPIREGGSEAYLKAKPYYPWTGRGLIQVTWEANGKKFGAEAPDDLLTWPVALSALFDGMIRGLFTGHKLADYFSLIKDDPIGARHIINGSDHAGQIALIHKNFLLALDAAAQGTAPPVAPPSAPAPSFPPPPATLDAYWTRVFAALADLLRAIFSRTPS